MGVHEMSERMRVSFDLDETLFVSEKTHKTEPQLPFPLRNFFKERLREGTPLLVHELQKMGYEVWVYTSSFRSDRYIRLLFRCYGIYTHEPKQQQHKEQEKHRSYSSNCMSFLFSCHEQKRYLLFSRNNEFHMVLIGYIKYAHYFLVCYVLIGMERYIHRGIRGLNSSQIVL